MCCEKARALFPDLIELALCVQKRTAGKLLTNLRPTLDLASQSRAEALNLPLMKICINLNALKPNVRG